MKYFLYIPFLILMSLTYTRVSENYKIDLRAMENQQKEIKRVPSSEIKKEHYLNSLINCFKHQDRR